MTFSNDISIKPTISATMPIQSLQKNTAFGFAFRQHIDQITGDWEAAAPADNVFLQRPYLQLLEQNAPEGMRFCYLVFYKKNIPIGVSACQIVGFNAEKSLQSNDKDTSNQKSPCFFTAMANYLKSFVASRMDFNTLVCGNLLLTGEHGFYFDSTKVPMARAFDVVAESLEYTRKQLRKQKLDIAVTLVKDYYTTTRSAATSLTDRNFNEFTIQPNMVLKIRPDWHTFEDYMAAMTSKYRVRVKRAAKKGKDIIKKELTVEEIADNLDRLYDLYKSIAINAGFNVVLLNKNYFLALKQRLQDDFRLTAYYLDGKLIGYYTLIRNHDELEAHFLGFDKTKNSSHQIYLNMLYDMVRHGIEGQYHRLIFARTALEIKSSVGAAAQDMYCYMRHKYNLSNRLFTPIYDYLKPELDWQPRHPFKT